MMRIIPPRLPEIVLSIYKACTRRGLAVIALDKGLAVLKITMLLR